MLQNCPLTGAGRKNDENVLEIMAIVTQHCECSFFPLKFSNDMFIILLSHFSLVRLCATPEMAAHQAPPSLGFSRQEHWSGLRFPSPVYNTIFYNSIISFSTEAQLTYSSMLVSGVLHNDLTISYIIK